jgi:RimJ/RimL family protein N-acetyltransferase
MENVGFPRGLPLTEEDVKRKLLSRPDTDFDRLIALEITGTGEGIGECSLHHPDEEGVARTDVKLLPEHWGAGYGTEVKKALLDYLFTLTCCAAVEASPNVRNRASIKMQEAVGGVRTGEGVHGFPESMAHFTVPVRYFVYRVTRESWEASRPGGSG